MTSEAKAKKEAAALAPIDAMRQTIAALAPEFKAALPPQIPVERFVRTIITTVQMNPDLLACDRKSVLATCMKAAQDGLLLDGREAAAVIFKNRATGTKQCQYIPMVAGILKKMRNSGDIASVDVQTVYENDHFVYELGDTPKIEHKPVITGPRGESICWYAVVKTKDGGIYREVMNKTDIEKVRKVSKAKSEDSPWNTWYEEMAEKTALKRIAKRCPSSADVDQVIEHDNEVVGFAQKGPSEAAPEKDTPGRTPSYLRALAEAEQPETEVAVAVNPEGGEASGEAATALPETQAMISAAKEAMDSAVGNRQLDAAWERSVPENLKKTDPESYGVLLAHYNDRLKSFRPKE